MCKKAVKNKNSTSVDSYSHALRFGPDCCKTQKMCNKAAGTYPSATYAIRPKKCAINLSILFLLF